jgi:hypothetical protein
MVGRLSNLGNVKKLPRTLAGQIGEGISEAR